MEIEDFSYIRCVNCKNVKIIPIPYKNNGNLLSNMCDGYNEINECCSDSHNSFADVKFGIEEGHIKISDLPPKLRKEFPPEVTHEFACGKHSLIMTNHNGDKVIVSINGDNIMVTGDYSLDVIYCMDDLNV